MAEGLILRDAAAEFAVSFSWLGMLERGEVTRPPNQKLLGRMSEVYKLNILDLMREAGIQPVSTPVTTAPNVRSQLERLFAHPQLRPSGFNDGDEKHIPDSHMGWIVDFAVNLERFLAASPGKEHVGKIIGTETVEVLWATDGDANEILMNSITTLSGTTDPPAPGEDG